MLVIIKDVIFSICIISMVYGGVIFTKKFKFIQFNLKKMFTSLKNDPNKVSPFNSLMMSLAAKIGVGSLAGIALAIYIGGPGVVLWIWLVSILTSPNTFVESILGKRYQQKSGNIYTGGPSYYIKKGLLNKKLGILYSILLIFTFIIGFNTIQSNTISKIIAETYSISFVTTGLILSIITFFVIIKNSKKIIDFVSKLVPVMASIYIIISLYILIKNYSSILPLLKLILNSALNFKSFGTSIFYTILIGMQKGIFTTEAGLGTAAIAAAMTDSKDESKVGYIQMFGVNFTTFIICTSTAFIILLSNYNNFIYDAPNGIEITKYAFNFHLGNFGDIFLIIVICLFAFSTVVSGYYYGESSLKFFYPQISENKIFFFKIFTVLLIFFGSMLNPTILWNLADIFIALLGIINMYSIIKLKNML